MENKMRLPWALMVMTLLTSSVCSSSLTSAGVLEDSLDGGETWRHRTMIPKSIGAVSTKTMVLSVEVVKRLRVTDLDRGLGYQLRLTLDDDSKTMVAICSLPICPMLSLLGSTNYSQEISVFLNTASTELEAIGLGVKSSHERCIFENPRMDTELRFQVLTRVRAPTEILEGPLVELGHFKSMKATEQHDTTTKKRQEDPVKKNAEDMTFWEKYGRQVWIFVGIVSINVVLRRIMEPPRP